MIPLSIIEKETGKRKYKIVICSQLNDLTAALEECNENNRLIITHEVIDSQRLKDNDTIIMISGKICSSHPFPKTAPKFIAFNFLTPETQLKTTLAMN